MVSVLGFLHAGTLLFKFNDTLAPSCIICLRTVGLLLFTNGFSVALLEPITLISVTHQRVSGAKKAHLVVIDCPDINTAHGHVKVSPCRQTESSARCSSAC